MRTRKLFVAGATGATGRTVLRLASPMAVDLVPHVRPRSAEKVEHPQRAVLELADHPALVEAMRGCTTVLQLIGTMRKRFSSGDTYETSDIGTTRQLVDAAKEAGVDHLVLLSSVGAGRPVGAYLQAKAEVERIVRESGIDWTIVRPSSFVGEGHRAPPGMSALTRMLGLHTFRPIRMEELAAAILHVAEERAPVGEVLEGRSLWRVVDSARQRFGVENIG